MFVLNNLVKSCNEWWCSVPIIKVRKFWFKVDQGFELDRGGKNRRSVSRGIKIKFVIVFSIAGCSSYYIIVYWFFVTFIICIVSLGNLKVSGGDQWSRCWPVVLCIDCRVFCRCLVKFKFFFLGGSEPVYYDGWVLFAKDLFLTDYYFLLLAEHTVVPRASVDLCRLMFQRSISPLETGPYTVTRILSTHVRPPTDLTTMLLTIGGGDFWFIRRCEHTAGNSIFFSSFLCTRFWLKCSFKYSCSVFDMFWRKTRVRVLS